MPMLHCVTDHAEPETHLPYTFEWPGCMHMDPYGSAIAVDRHRTPTKASSSILSHSRHSVVRMLLCTTEHAAPGIHLLYTFEWLGCMHMDPYGSAIGVDRCRTPTEASSSISYHSRCIAVLMLH